MPAAHRDTHPTIAGSGKPRGYWDLRSHPKKPWHDDGPANRNVILRSPEESQRFTQGGLHQSFDTEALRETSESQGRVAEHNWTVLRRLKSPYLRPYMKEASTIIKPNSNVR
jgi:hypothetical protein